MRHRKMIAGVATMAVAAAGTGVAVAASGSASKNVTITEKAGTSFKANRYVQDNLRFAKDEYTVKSGGTVTLVNNQANEGPHTISALKPTQVPRTAKQANNCAACNALGQAHGADPNTEGPPKFVFVDNGVGTSTPAKFDRAGDSAISGPNKGDKVTVPVTAKAGTTLHLVCIIHPWMQTKLKVVK
jgi:plastocyanin